MAESKTFIERKFLLEKKTITLEDFIAYIQDYHPEDKVWFYNLCCTEQPLNEKEPDGKKGILSFLAIKSRFYNKYFKDEDTLTKRMKLFVDWNIKDDTEAKDAATKE